MSNSLVSPENASTVGPNITENQSHSASKFPVITIGIAGGTGSGKTTLALALYKTLGEAEHVTYLTHDNYYKSLSHLPISEREKVNFDHPDSLDTELLVRQLKSLKSGKSIGVPTYDFTTHTRKENEVTEESPKHIILLEGIPIFSDERLAEQLDVKIFVDEDPDVRLIRRVTRDTVERGRTTEEVMNQYMSTVRPMHNQFVEPSKRIADVIIPSAINSVALQMITDYVKKRVSVKHPSA